MPSGPVEREFFVSLMALAVIPGVKNWACLSRSIMCSLQWMCLFWQLSTLTENENKCLNSFKLQVETSFFSERTIIR